MWLACFALACGGSHAQPAGPAPDDAVEAANTQTTSEPASGSETETEAGSEMETPPAARTAVEESDPAIDFRAVYRDGRGHLYVTVEGGEAPDQGAELLASCAPDRCGFQLFVAPRDAADTSGEPIFVVRPNGAVCEGTTGQPVFVGLVDTLDASGPVTRDDAEWVPAVGVEGCEGGEEAVRFGIFARGDARPRELLVREPTAEEEALIHRDRDRPTPRGKRIETVAWRQGERLYVRLRTCPRRGPCETNDESFEVFDAGQPIEDEEMELSFGDTCCERITGLVDLDGDQSPDVITRHAYPIDASGVTLGVSWGRHGGFDARLPSAYPED